MTPRSPVLVFDTDGVPLALADGRSRNDGRCRREQHAFPDVEPVRNAIEDGVAIAETCVSCGTIRSVMIGPNGAQSRARYFYPPEA